MATRMITAGELAEIAESSPGYSVTAVEGDEAYELTEIGYARSSSGRRVRAEIDCRSNGRLARFSADERLEIQD